MVYSLPRNFGVTLLTAKSFGFNHSHPFDPDFGEGIFNIFQFKWFDN